MEPVEYLRALRRWWWVIAASVAVGIGGSLLAASGSTTTYRATNDLVYAPPAAAEGESSADPATTLTRTAFLATRGSLPDRVAKRLGSDDPSGLARRVSVFANGELLTLSITATGSDARGTERLVNTYASELVASLDEAAVAQQQQQIERLRNEADDLQGQVAALDGQISANPDSVALTAQREALASRYSAALESLQALNAGSAPSSGLSTVESARAVATSSEGTSPATRIAVAGFVGLLIGAGLALLLTRFDTRIRTKEEAEEAFGLPVIAEIPLLTRARRERHDVISITDTESAGAEAYRSLRTSLVFAPRVRWSLGETQDRPHRGKGTSRAAEAPDPARSQTVLVVSPGVGEGKSTTVANLAVAFAESGKYVLVISGDLRRPAVDRYLGVEPGPGVSELLAAEGGLRLVDVVRATNVADVRMAPSGDAVSNPGELLSHHGAELLDQARKLADVVLVDSPPILATDDTSPLIPRIDDVVVVCRAGVTSAEAARRTSELLSRLGASVAGVALVGVTASSTARGYYRAYERSRGKGEAHKKSARVSREALPEGPQPANDERGKASTRPQASDTA